MLDLGEWHLLLWLFLSFRGLGKWLSKSFWALIFGEVDLRLGTFLSFWVVGKHLFIIPCLILLTSFNIGSFLSVCETIVDLRNFGESFFVLDALLSSHLLGKLRPRHLHVENKSFRRPFWFLRVNYLCLGGLDGHWLLSLLDHLLWFRTLSFDRLWHHEWHRVSKPIGKALGLMREPSLGALGQLVKFDLHLIPLLVELRHGLVLLSLSLSELLPLLTCGGHHGVGQCLLEALERVHRRHRALHLGIKVLHEVASDLWMCGLFHLF